MTTAASAWRVELLRGAALPATVRTETRSTYRSGSTRSWAKAKVRHEGVFRVGGIRTVDAFDGALVGEDVDGELVYRGVVEWGFRAADVLELLREAERPLRTSPFAHCVSVEPVLGEEARLSQRPRAEIAPADLQHVESM